MDSKGDFSVYERTKLIEWYLATKSLVTVRRRFAREFPKRRVPHNSTILRLYAKFCETGSVADDKTGKLGTKPTTRDQGY